MEIRKLLPLNVLYSDGTISKEYIKEKEIVAISAGESFIALKDVKAGVDKCLSCADWFSVKEACETIRHEMYASYMPKDDEMFLWRENIDEINSTINVLQTEGLDVEKLSSKNVYWTSVSHTPLARAVNFENGNIEFNRKSELCHGRYAIKLST